MSTTDHDGGQPTSASPAAEHDGGKGAVHALAESHTPQRRAERALRALNVLTILGLRAGAGARS